MLRRFTAPAALLLALPLTPSALGVCTIEPTNEGVFSAVTDEATALIRAGLDPEALAAAGVAGGGVADVVADLTASNAFQGGDLPTADAAYATAKKTADELQRLIRSGQATAQNVTDYQTAKSNLEQAVTDRDAVLDALFTAGTADLSNTAKAALSTIRSNRSHRLPMEFLVITRTDAEWIDLRDRLMEEKVCAKLGDTVCQETATKLANWRAQSDVATAKTRLDTNLAAVKAAWDTAVE